MNSVPKDFLALPLDGNGFIQANGPMYGRWAEQRFTLGMRVEQRHCNPGNTCHGGMLMTLADMTMLLGIRLQSDIAYYLTTINLTTDFIGPAHIGDWIEGRCEILRASKNLVFAQGDLRVRGHDGRYIARINGIFKPISNVAIHSDLHELFGVK